MNNSSVNPAEVRRNKLNNSSVNPAEVRRSKLHNSSVNPAEVRRSKLQAKLWSDRDIELDLRNRLASLVAVIVSGVEGAEPEPFDYIMADTFRVLVEEKVE